MSGDQLASRQGHSLHPTHIPIPSVECNVSADQSLYSSSFGDPNAQPPTPQQTPSSAVFPSSVFETPKNNQGSFSDSGNWTPRFAEDYSVFNSTPGNLRGTQGPFPDFVSAVPAGSSGHKRLLSAEGFATEIATSVNHFSPNPNGPLPPVDPARRLPSSPSVVNTPREYCADSEAQQASASSKPQSTKKIRRETVHELQGTQTITPPPSSHKGGRKLAPKLKMQNDQGFGQPDFAGAPQHDMQAFMGNPDDMFNYPLSAPVTAPNFWDPSMAMSMDLDFAVGGAALFQNAVPGNHRPQQMSQAFAWNGDLPMFQDPLAAPVPADHDSMNFMRRDRAIAPKQPEPASVSAAPNTMASASFSAPSMTDPFGLVHPGDAVDPGLLYSRPQTSAMEAGFNTADNVRSLDEFGSNSRGQGAGDVRRNSSTRDAKNGKMPDRAFTSSPVKGSARPGLGRSFSENRGKKTLGRGSVAPLAPAARTGSSGSASEAASRPSVRSGRSSPLKSQHRLSELASIPESLSQPCARTSVKFTIDSRGRARAETTMMSGDFDTDRSISRSQSSRDLSRQRSWDPSEDDESTDDEPIIIPSRNNSFNASFALPDPRKPVGSIFHSSRRSISDKSTSTSATADSLNAPLHEGESEAETLMNEHADKGGDAASELRKLVQDRQKRSAQMSSSKSQRLLSVPTRSMYGGPVSPTSLTDMSHGSDAAVIRCICNKNEANGQDGFMVQW
ncbi:hypothetical protein HJFPF1_02740 [Paramyrothecium foliicola]|nr:hypothetical protein HJFPF1_02740 [Paramyrothecium foliicola]